MNRVCRSRKKSKRQSSHQRCISWRQLIQELKLVVLFEVWLIPPQTDKKVFEEELPVLVALLEQMTWAVDPCLFVDRFLDLAFKRREGKSMISNGKSGLKSMMKLSVKGLLLSVSFFVRRKVRRREGRRLIFIGNSRRKKEEEGGGYRVFWQQYTDKVDPGSYFWSCYSHSALWFVYYFLFLCVCWICGWTVDVEIERHRKEIGWSSSSRNKTPMIPPTWCSSRFCRKSSIILRSLDNSVMSFPGSLKVRPMEQGLLFLRKDYISLAWWPFSSSRFPRTRSSSPYVASPGSFLIRRDQLLLLFNEDEKNSLILHTSRGWSKVRVCFYSCCLLLFVYEKKTAFHSRFFLFFGLWWSSRKSIKSGRLYSCSSRPDLSSPSLITFAV